MISCHDIAAPRRRGVLAAGALLAVGLAGCAGLGRDRLRVTVAGFEPLQGQGMELRFAVRLRLQNPTETAVDYDGVALEFEVNRMSLASGVSDVRGSLPRYGETVLTVPVTISAFSIVRQALGLAAGEALDEVPFEMNGKLGGGALGALRFSERGTLNLARLGLAGR